MIIIKNPGKNFTRFPLTLLYQQYNEQKQDVSFSKMYEVSKKTHQKQSNVGHFC
jgi:hypothetical protein